MAGGHCPGTPKRTRSTRLGLLGVLPAWRAPATAAVVPASRRPGVLPAPPPPPGHQAPPPPAGPGPPPPPGAGSTPSLRPRWGRAAAESGCCWGADRSKRTWGAGARARAPSGCPPSLRPHPRRPPPPPRPPAAAGRPSRRAGRPWRGGTGPGPARGGGGHPSPARSPGWEAAAPRWRPGARRWRDHRTTTPPPRPGRLPGRARTHHHHLCHSPTKPSPEPCLSFPIWKMGLTALCWEESGQH